MLTVPRTLAALCGLIATIVGCPGPPDLLDGGRDGGIGDAPGLDAPNVATDAGPCGVCSGTTPLCDEVSGNCVECLGTGDCGGSTPACVMGSCVACDDNADCTSPTASTCDTTANTCGGCEADADCTHLSATPVCNEASNTCVACTADTEAARCGANSCNPATFACTSTPRTSVTTCGACVSDTECRNADERCVPMEFMGAARTGGYCLKQLDTGCAQPFTTPTPARASLSGAAAEVYCGLVETVTTCEAVLALINNDGCTTDDDCGAPGLADGRCELVNGVANKCTYGCTAASQCESGFMCPVVADRYCGAT
jgi:hypothetical protein